MKVLQLTKFYPPVRGGIESTTYDITEGLNAAGVRTDVLCSNLTRRTVTETHGAYTVTRAASFGKMLSTSLAPALVVELARRHRGYDLLHVHMPDPLSTLALRLVRPRAKLVVHWHSDVVNQKRALRFYAPLQRWLLQRADAVLVTSQAYGLASPHLADFRSKLHVVPSCIPELARDSSLADAMKARYGGRRIVFALGRMTSYKGFDVLVEAATDLTDDCVVVIAGGGELLASHRDLVAARGLGQRVFLPGEISTAEVHALFAAADVFCLPSVNRAEAFGLVLVEAMASGRPIVATDIPGSGVPWVNQHGMTGLNVPVRDPAALAGAIRLLLDDPALAARYGAAARQRYLDHFTARSMVALLQGIYAGLLG